MPRCAARAAAALRGDPLLAGPRHRAAAATRCRRPPTYAELAYAQLAQLARQAGADGRPAAAVRRAGRVHARAAGRAARHRERRRRAGGRSASMRASRRRPSSRRRPPLLQLDLTLHRAVVTVLGARAASCAARATSCCRSTAGWRCSRPGSTDRRRRSCARRASTRCTRRRPSSGCTTRCRAGLQPCGRPIRCRSSCPRRAARSASSSRARNSSRRRVACYDAVVHVLQRARPAGGPLHLRVSHRWIGAARASRSASRTCATAPCCRCRAVRPRSVRWPSSACCDASRPGLRSCSGCRCRWRAEVAAAAEPASRVAPADRPTHVVHLRSRLAAARRAAARRHGGSGRATRAGGRCRPRRLAAALHARAATATASGSRTTAPTARFVNDERVGGRVALRVGDLLRLGHPGVELELIRVVDGDGAP